ncbi:trypco2 family protein [Dactylosporangium sp. NPDC051541]|uniref:trypco2 family protein n=1 Tax=Dactylosporangium sp. NPDC051541 TaxID=3363977 RepID=UPI0037A0EF1B
MGERPVSVGLAEAVAAVRAELLRAQRLGADSAMPFEVGSVEIELGVELESSGGGKFGVNVYAVEAGIEGKSGRTATHKLTVTLHPKDRATGGSATISGHHDADPLG